MAPEAILRLSKILRFMLYETSGDFISIEKEVKVITDYIELEKLRYDELLRITFHQQINNLNQQIPPLILIPLVENAFKHGTSETTGNQFVDIHLTVQNGWLIFIVKNSAGSLSEKMMKENIGLSNLRRQLAFLFKEYNLTVDHSESVFTVILKINLTSHV